MYEITDKSPEYIHYINGYGIPDWMYEFIRADAIEHDYKMLDYIDGDFKYVIDLNPTDPTPVSELEKFHAGEEGYDETSYPYLSWEDDADDGDFGKYISWQLIIKHLRDNVPPHVVATNLFAVSI